MADNAQDASSPVTAAGIGGGLPLPLKEMPHTPAKHTSMKGLTPAYYFEKGGFSQAQAATLAAIAETIVPSMPDAVTRRLIRENKETIAKFGGPEPPSDADLALFLRASASDMHVVDCMIRLVATEVPDDLREVIKTVLWALGTGWGTALITGARSVPFVDLSVPEREQALLNLSGSRFEMLRGLFKSLKAIVTLPFFGKSMALEGYVAGDEVPNVSWPALGYPGPHPDEHQIPEEDAVWTPTFIDIQALAEQAGKDKPVVLECDVVIVGSGAGGGTVAATLAKAGHKVIVLEKALYRHHTDLTNNELESFSTFYEAGAALASENGAMMILAGNAWGGGTHVNWCASFVTPHKVRAEWATKYGLPYFASMGFQNALEAVCERLGVSDEFVEHNASNQLFIKGCKKCGYDVSTIPQNTGRKHHNCGWCTFGCPYAQKQGSHRTWLQDAAEHGAEFVQGAYVERVTYAKGRATGVVGYVKLGNNVEAQKLRFVVKAPTVVSSCGSVNTPALLLRSGLKNPNIGRNLRLHPVTTVHGFFPQTLTRPFSGAMMTAVSDVVADIDGTGYGAKLEIYAAHPGTVGSTLPWRNPEDYRRLMLQFPRSVNMIVLTRDNDSTARVFIDKAGRPRIDFNLGKRDSATMVKGLEAGAKILAAAGAVEINTSQLGSVPLRLEDEATRADPCASPAMKEWLDKTKRLGVKMNSAGLSCAHQMGSCRMGATPAMGAVNPDGESWEVKGLYVADASLFPTASGVNPMITTFAVSYSVGQFIKRNLEKKGGKGSKL
ncbi:hypothetical protein HDU96_008747 [Phlyctochytrium bullatum]|nr:hypothetical protein HDU96_008747 [Phlyctochytrium bullatum]